MTFTWSAATIALLLPLAAACSRSRRPIGNPWPRSVLPGRRRGPGRRRSRHREAAGRLARTSRRRARGRTPRLSLRGAGARRRTTRATTPWPNRRPRASSRCSRTSRRRCCSAGTCCTRCTASARPRRSRGAWSTLREFVLDFGLLGDALMEQGRLAEAAEAYQKMIDLKPFYQSYTRAAHLRWLRGDLDGAIDMMQAAVKAASPRDPESIAWAYSRLAVYELQRGRLAEAGADGRRVAAVRARLRRRAARPRPHPARAEEACRRRRDADARGAPQSAARIPVGARRRASRC